MKCVWGHWMWGAVALALTLGCDEFSGNGAGPAAPCGTGGVCPTGLTCQNNVCVAADVVVAGDGLTTPETIAPQPDTIGPCVPRCAGVECGTDGCGGYCGLCPAGETCMAGHCSAGCVANCTGRQCGNDDCGGSCGNCDTGMFCNAQQQCEQGVCTPDCAGKQCGDNGCGGSCGTCAANTSCNAQQQCVPNGCTPECGGKQCGSNGCSGTCGTCPAGRSCVDGQCTTAQCGQNDLTLDGTLDTAVAAIAFDNATVQIVHKQDVDPWEDGCFVSIAIDLTRGYGCTLHLVANQIATAEGGLKVSELTFAADSQCPGFPDTEEGQYYGYSEQFTAEVVPGIDGVPDENAPQSCFFSAMEVHIEGTLREEYGERSLTIEPSVIRLTGDFTSQGSTWDSCPCAQQCVGKECGDDGCGGQCGNCTGEAYCEAGQCVLPCEPTCTNRQCGDNGCGGSCGTCAAGKHCQNYQCVVDCTPSCQGKECGSDGCGNQCGTCTSSETCQAGQCVAPQTCDNNGFSVSGDETAEYSSDGTNEVVFYKANSDFFDPFDQLGIELWYNLGGPSTPGSYTITDDNYQSCSLCVVMLQSCQSSGGCEKVFLAQSGALTLDEVGTTGDTLTATISNVEFIEVTIDTGTWVSTPVANGETWCIDQFDFSTSIVAAQ